MSWWCSKCRFKCWTHSPERREFRTRTAYLRVFALWMLWIVIYYVAMIAFTLLAGSFPNSMFAHYRAYFLGGGAALGIVGLIVAIPAAFYWEFGFDSKDAH